MELTGAPKGFRLTKSRLEGQVRVSGAKNSALKLLAASLLTPEGVTLGNFPDTIGDVHIQVEMLRRLGKVCEIQDGQVVITEPQPLSRKLIWTDRSIRSTLLNLGALVARFGEGAVPLPGGCDIGDQGERKYDIHLMLMRALGAELWQEDEYLCATRKGRLKGADIHLPVRSTGATENGILCGVLAEGTTRIWNPHVRPEILDLVAMLRSMGAKIEVEGQQCITIEGVDGLGPVQHNVVPDNMEAITWTIGALVTGGDVEITSFPHEHLEVPLIFLRESGARFFRGPDSLIVRGDRCYPVEIATGPYPGINSDMQPLFTVFGLCALGTSKIIDLRFPGRFQYVAELEKMSGRFSVEDGVLKVLGGHRLQGTTVRALDLRAGACLAIAALVADGETRILDGYQITRGYDHFEDKLRKLGADVARIQ